MPQIIPIPLTYVNAYLIKGRRTILIDTGPAHDFNKLIKALQAHNVQPQELALILHTHGHFDHCGSTKALKTLTQAPIAIHQMDYPMLKSGQNGPLVPTRFSAWLYKMLFSKLRFATIEADIIIKDEGDLTAYGVDATYIFTPGHTVGSISIITANNEAIIGDLLMGGYLGSIIQPTKPRYHYYAYDITVVHWSLKKVLKQNPTTLYVGHGGPLTTTAVLERFGDEL